MATDASKRPVLRRQLPGWRGRRDGHRRRAGDEEPPRRAWRLVRDHVAGAAPQPTLARYHRVRVEKCGYDRHQVSTVHADVTANRGGVSMSFTLFQQGRQIVEQCGWARLPHRSETASHARARPPPSGKIGRVSCRRAGADGTWRYFACARPRTTQRGFPHRQEDGNVTANLRSSPQGAADGDAQGEPER